MAFLHFRNFFISQKNCGFDAYAKKPSIIQKAFFNNSLFGDAYYSTRIKSMLSPDIVSVIFPVPITILYV